MRGNEGLNNKGKKMQREAHDISKIKAMKARKLMKPSGGYVGNPVVMLYAGTLVCLLVCIGVVR
jgi:hypothetical protein